VLKDNNRRIPVVQQIYDDEIDLREYLSVIVKRWKTIVLIIIVLTVGSYIFSKTQKPVFEAKTTVLLRSSGSSSGSSQLAALAGMAGINLSGSGSGNLGDLTELMKSRAVAKKVLIDLNLRSRIKGWDNPKLTDNDLAISVSGMLKPSKMTGNILEIKAEAGTPELAADIANGYVAAISYYWNELNATEAQKKLQYIESELPRVEQELKNSENKLKLVPRSFGGLSLSGQSGIQRDYDIYSSVYSMLKKEHESTKLDASKELPPFSIVDQALVPKHRSKPNTKLNIVIGFVLGVFVGIFIAFFQEYWEKSGGTK